MDKASLFYDGDCVLCQRSVQWLIKRDKKGLIQFGLLQGQTAQTILSEVQTKQLSTLVLVYQQKQYVKSDAFLLLMKLLNWPYKVLYVFILVPKFMRDAVYDLVAKNRYKWFGQHDNCWLPEEKDKWRFLG